MCGCPCRLLALWADKYTGKIFGVIFTQGDRMLEVEGKSYQNRKERLIIKNFFSIKSFDWDIKDFNILTGGMASGKSLCLKLLHFLENIFNITIFYENITKEYLKEENIFNRIKKEFENIFQKYDFDYSNTEVNYSYSDNTNIFDLCAKCNNESNELVWSSEYIKNHIKKWQSYLDKEDTPDNSRIALKRIYESISKDFYGSLPFGTIFIPSLRAIAAITDNNGYRDIFLSDFINDLKPFVLRFEQLSTEDINKILHIKGMMYDENTRELRITLSDDRGNRKISPLVLSSGQQELLYLLLLVGHLEDTRFIFGKRISIFIEEPSAHLFPLEQKETIEFIVKIFRALKENTTKLNRFFITTHSPYILNVINTIMNRGRLKIELDKLDNKDQEFIDTDTSLHLMRDEISAYYIEYNGQVNSMIPEGESFLYGDKIDDISQNIFDEANKIEELFSMIKARKQK
jgi:predicted ATPase